MSTPSSVTPNPPRDYRPVRQRSIFGPIVLIGVGLLLLLTTMGRISPRAFGLFFARYWPVLLIIWGVVKFLEYLWARQKGYPPPRLGGGSIVFLVFFIMFGMAASQTARLNWNGIRGDINVDDSDVSDFLDGIFGGSRYEFTNSFAQPVEEATQIKILGDRGDIKISPSKDAQAHFVVQKTMRSESQQEASRMNDATLPKLERQGSVLILDMASGNYARGRFDLDLELPHSAALSVSTHAGNITVIDWKGDLELSSDRGDISSEQITGDASAHVRRGSVSLKKVSGNVSVDGTVSNTTLADIGGTATLSGTYWGDMQLERIAKTVHFSSSRTDLQFARLEGDFNMEPDDLRAKGIVGPFRLDTRSKGVHLQDVTGDIHIDNRNAEIELRPKGPLGNIDVTSVHGEITLEVPPNAGFELNAESVGGEIQSEFDVKTDNTRRTATAKGTVGKGGPEVRLKADRGTITIRKQ